MPYYDIVVNLSGEDGNALVLISKVKRALQRNGVESHKVALFVSEATSADYDHLLRTCMKWVDVR